MFSSYRWFCDGVEIGSGQSWSAGAKGEQLSSSSVYHVEVVTYDHQIFRSCESRITSKSLELKAWTNPVSVGKTLYIEADESMENAVVEVYDMLGRFVGYQRLQGSLTPVDIQYATGIYVFVFIDRKLKIVVSD